MELKEIIKQADFKKIKKISPELVELSEIIEQKKQESLKV